MTPHLPLWFIIATKFFPLLFLVISLTNVPSASAITPLTVVRPQYASVNGTLYIQGGAHNSVNPISAFYSLSLTKPWNDTAPLWKALPTNSSGVLAPTIWVQTMSATADMNNVLIWDFSRPNMSPLFNIEGKSWTELNLPPITWTTIHGLFPLIDPGSPGLGTFYVPNGCLDSSVFPAVWYMCKLDLTSTTITRNIPMSDQTAGVVYYSFVYCSSRNSMMLYGGYVTRVNVAYAMPNLSEYNMAANTWTLLPTSGTPPGDVNSHCMVETTDGTKMILFGGVSVGNLVSSRLYILHLGNLTWVQGPDAGSLNTRYGHVCSTNGDSFVAWGGQSSVLMSNIPLIYNIPMNQWVHDFVVSGPLPPNITTTTVSTLPTPTTTTTTIMPSPTFTPSSDVVSPAPSVSKLNKAGIIGSAAGAVGGVAVIAIFVFLLYRRRKRAARNTIPSSLPWNNEFMGFQKTQTFGRRGAWDDYEDDDDLDNAVRFQNMPRKVDVDMMSYPSSPYLESSSSSTIVYDQTAPSYQQHQPSDTASETASVSGTDLRYLTSSGLVQTPKSQHTFSVVSTPSITSNSIISTVPTSALSLPIYIHSKGRTKTKPSPTKLSQQIYSAGSDRAGLRLSPVYYGVNPEVLSYSQSPQYIPSGYEGRAVWENHNQAETRSPQQVGPRHETSPAAWASMMARASLTNEAPYTRRSRGVELPQSVQSPEPVKVGDGPRRPRRSRTDARSV